MTLKSGGKSPCMCFCVNCHALIVYYVSQSKTPPSGLTTPQTRPNWRAIDRWRLRVLNWTELNWNNFIPQERVVQQGIPIYVLPYIQQLRENKRKTKRRQRIRIGNKNIIYDTYREFLNLRFQCKRDGAVTTRYGSSFHTKGQFTKKST